MDRSQGHDSRCLDTCSRPGGDVGMEGNEKVIGYDSYQCQRGPPVHHNKRSAWSLVLDREGSSDIHMRMEIGGPDFAAMGRGSRADAIVRFEGRAYFICHPVWSV